MLGRQQILYARDLAGEEIPFKPILRSHLCQTQLQRSASSKNQPDDRNTM